MMTGEKAYHSVGQGVCADPHEGIRALIGVASLSGISCAFWGNNWI